MTGGFEDLWLGHFEKGVGRGPRRKTLFEQGNEQGLPIGNLGRRLWEVKKMYHAKAVVQFQWRKGKYSEFSVLQRNRKWKGTTSRELFD